MIRTLPLDVHALICDKLSILDIWALSRTSQRFFLIDRPWKERWTLYYSDLEYKPKSKLILIRIGYETERISKKFPDFAATIVHYRYNHEMKYPSNVISVILGSMRTKQDISSTYERLSQEIKKFLNSENLPLRTLRILRDLDSFNATPARLFKLIQKQIKVGTLSSVDYLLQDITVELEETNLPYLMGYPEMFMRELYKLIDIRAKDIQRFVVTWRHDFGASESMDIEITLSESLLLSIECLLEEDFEKFTGYCSRLKIPEQILYQRTLRDNMEYAKYLWGKVWMKKSQRCENQDLASQCGLEMTMKFEGAGALLRSRNDGDVIYMMERNPNYKNNDKKAHEIEYPGGKVSGVLESEHPSYVFDVKSSRRYIFR